MKPSKNQVQAVRSYLSSIGHEISHVQALEVIARGQGYRSRHVKQAEAVSVPPAPSCKKCGSVLWLRHGNCTDLTCPYWDWTQQVELHDLQTLTKFELLAKYGREALRDHDQELEDYFGRRSSSFRLHYGEDNEHPVFSRGEWLFESSKGRTSRPYWDWVAMKSYAALEGGAVEYCIHMDDKVFGNETYGYVTEEEREAGLQRLIAVALADKEGVHREYRYFESTGDTPDGASTLREVPEAKVYENGTVLYKGQFIRIPEILEVNGEKVFTGQARPSYLND